MSLPKNRVRAHRPLPADCRTNVHTGRCVSGRNNRAVIGAAVPSGFRLGSPFLIGLIVLAGFGCVLGAKNAVASAKMSSVSQHGVTWHFEEARPTGRYVNGDWWVLGPVTITNISPESVEVDGRVMHGSMLNPPASNSQGYDSNVPTQMPYEEDLNVAPSRTGRPLVIREGSVVSAISLGERHHRFGNRWLSDMAVLTAVEEEPDEGAFRPFPHSESKRSFWHYGDLNYEILQTLPIPDSAPNLQSLANQFERYHNPHSTGWFAQRLIPINNWPGNAYGREFANRIGLAMLALHLDLPQDQKRDLFVNLVQLGLDIYGRVVSRNGANWYADGGHNVGRMPALAFAALALGDPEMLAMVRGGTRDSIAGFQEDQQTFIVAEADVGRKLRTADRTEYTEDDVGMPEWGVRHYSRPEDDDRSWTNPGYRFIGATMVTTALGIELIPNGRAAFNWEPYFLYARRYLEKEGGDHAQIGRPGSTNGIPLFAIDMWETFLALETVAPPKPPVVRVE